MLVSFSKPDSPSPSSGLKSILQWGMRWALYALMRGSQLSPDVDSDFIHLQEEDVYAVLLEALEGDLAEELAATAIVAPSQRLAQGVNRRTWFLLLLLTQRYSRPVPLIAQLLQLVVLIVREAVINGSARLGVLRDPAVLVAWLQERDVLNELTDGVAVDITANTQGCPVKTALALPWQLHDGGANAALLLEEVSHCLK